MKLPIANILAGAILLNACAPVALAPDDKERSLLTAKMVKLSSVVEKYFWSLSEMPFDETINILRSATRDNPSLLAPEFEPYQFKVQYQNPYAVLLLCSKDGSRAIMEDAGCSADLDRQVTDAATPCEFKLVVQSKCKIKRLDPH